MFNHPADTNGDGRVSDEKTKCIWNSREKNLMTKIYEIHSKKDGYGLSLFGMLLYPFIVVFYQIDKVRSHITNTWCDMAIQHTLYQFGIFNFFGTQFILTKIKFK